MEMVDLWERQQRSANKYHKDMKKHDLAKIK